MRRTRCPKVYSGSAELTDEASGQVVAAAFIGRTESDFSVYAPSAVVILVAGLLGNTILPVWCVLNISIAGRPGRVCIFRRASAA